jgi:transcriptional regulator of heat shock response
MTVREALHHLNTPDISDKLSEKLEKFKEKHDRYIKEDVELNVDVLVNENRVDPLYDTPVSNLTDSDKDSIKKIRIIA